MTSEWSLHIVPFGCKASLVNVGKVQRVVWSDNQDFQAFCVNVGSIAEPDKCWLGGRHCEAKQLGTVQMAAMLHLHFQSWLG